MTGGKDDELGRMFITGRAGASPQSAHGSESEESSSEVVRSYVLTGGRTRARRDLGYETLVTATRRTARRQLSPEGARIVKLARRPISAAEISAKLRIPIGVALILISDLADDDLVTFQLAPKHPAADISLLQRLRNGISAL